MLPEAFAPAFMQKAFLAGALSASALSIVGVFIVLKRMSNIGEGLSNVAFAGLALGILFGAAPLPLAFAATVVGVLLIQHISDKGIVFGETAVQIMCAGGFALGVVVVSMSSGFNVNLLEYLFGSILSVSDSDIVTIAALAASTLIAVAYSWRQLTYTVFDEDSAQAAGLPTKRLNLLLMMIAAASIVAGMRIVGILLVSSMLVVPAAAAIAVARSFRQTVALSAGFAVSSVLIGLTAAFYLNVAAGGAVVLVQVLMFFAAAYLGERL